MKRTPTALLVLFSLTALVVLAGPARTPAQAISTPSALWAWEALTLPAGLTVDDVNDLAVHPDDAETAFLATQAGLYRTTDAGDTWTQVATTTLTLVYEVAIPAADPQRLYARQYSNLYRSDDGGDTWNLAGTPPSFCGLGNAPGSPDRLYTWACWGAAAAVFRSDDGGTTWFTPTLSFNPTLYSLVVSPVDANHVIASAFDALYRSTDGGASWADLPMGTRYNGQVTFDPQEPTTLYVGHWTGLLRSTDSGSSWQDSDCEREFATLIPAPWARRAVLGGENDVQWRLAWSSTSWQASAWNVPESLQWLRRSANDSEVLYALGTNTLWRYIHRRPAYMVFLPTVYYAGPETTFPEPARQAADRLNGYRALVEAVPVRLHAAIITAAQNHANYYLLNHNDPGAWTYGYHGEVEGKPGYTGKWPLDRMQAAGYPSYGGSEVMHFLGDPAQSVDDWIGSVFHRVIALDPDQHDTGYGHGAEPAVDVMDFGTGPLDAGLWGPALPYPQAYPTDGQTDIPRSWEANEIPDPLPPGASRPVGYPFTLQGIHGTLVGTWAEMRDGNNNVVAIHPNPSDCSTFNCYAVIAVSPLQPNTTYTVHVVGTVGGVSFDRTWHFTTGAELGEAAGDASPRTPCR